MVAHSSLCNRGDADMEKNYSFHTNAEEFKNKLAEMDAFDRVQVSHVIEVCRQCRTLSEAGRLLFSASRGRKATTNDADRLRKYLNRFGIEWSQISPAADSARSQ
jgi:sigma54-dependent transcription regulator